MNMLRIVSGGLLVSMTAALLTLSAAQAAVLDKVDTAELGSVEIHGEQGPRDAFAILFSGDAGVDADDRLALQTLQKVGAVVALVDSKQAMARLAARDSQTCFNLSFLLEWLAQTAQKNLGMTRYLEPLLLGRDAGAALVYVTLAQAQPLAFRAGVSVDMATQLPISTRLCNVVTTPVSGAQQLLPDYPLHRPWRLAVTHAQPPQFAAFAQASIKAQPLTVYLPAPASLAMLYSEALRSEHSNSESAVVSDLPLVEVSDRRERGLLVIIWSGDGGWRDLDRTLGDIYGAKGYAVIGVDSLRYFWGKRGVDEVAADLKDIIRYYGQYWHIEQVALVGYSFGADVLPFAYNRLSAELQDRVVLLSLLAPQRAADFEVHVGGWWGAGPTEEALPIVPELNKIPVSKLQCVYGSEESEESLCTLPELANVERIAIPGGHHFDEDYAKLSRLIEARFVATLSAMPMRQERAAPH